MDIKCNVARGVLKKTTVGGKLAEILIGLVFIAVLSPFMLIATIGITLGNLCIRLCNRAAKVEASLIGSGTLRRGPV